jgi:hypothetical protein
MTIMASKKSKRKDLPKPRNSYAASLFDPASPFRCKVIDPARKINRQPKHKKTDDFS